MPLTPTPQDLLWSADRIAAAIRTWNAWPGFTGESCGTCKATANVLAECAGWFCPCGHFNCQSMSNHRIPHDAPTYGPTAAVIREGGALSDSSEANEKNTLRLSVDMCCFTCGNLIPEGDQGVYVPSNGIRHVVCPTG